MEAPRDRSSPRRSRFPHHPTRVLRRENIAVAMTGIFTAAFTSAIRVQSVVPL